MRFDPLSADSIEKALVERAGVQQKTAGPLARLSDGSYSSALDLMQKIVKERYPTSEWNIYGSQASDGDNWPDDASRCTNLLEQILPLVQYYAYIEISEQSPKALWKIYEPIQQSQLGTFAMQNITGPGDIYPVFRELFRKETA